MTSEHDPGHTRLDQIESHSTTLHIAGGNHWNWQFRRQTTSQRVIGDTMVELQIGRASCRERV